MYKNKILIFTCILMFSSIYIQAENLNKSAEISDSKLSDLRLLLGEEPVASEKLVKKIEIKEEVVASEVPIEEPITKYNISFLDAPSDTYTINITTTNGLDAANEYVRENNLEKANTYSFGPELKSAKVIYGVFDSVDEAKIAINTLPLKVLSNKPYVDNILKHKKLYKKYHK